MAEIINLRLARKARDRAVAETRAQANRAKHGRTKMDKRATDMEQARIEQTLDGAKRDKED
jgi:hypothetical protein